VDVPDYKKLLEDLPNKIRDVLGIMVEVNLHEERGNHYLEIITPPYAVPISLRGVYYTRSGSTKQELKGNALIEFLLRKTGKSWDDVIEPAASLNDIDENAVKKFVRDAEESGRLPDLDGLSLQELLEKLRLMEAGKMKRAALVLFGKDPGRFFPNMVVKMGRFGTSDDDLRFQETAEGNLLRLLVEVPDVLNHKFFVKPVDFQGLQRIEKGEYPVAALREMLLNALVHRDYMGSTVQIRMYDDRFSIWNEGFLPQGLTLEALRRQHPSRPRNPLIADVCFKGGYIDAWGRGTLKIIHSCKEAGLPEPEMKEQDGGMLVSLFKDVYQERLWATYNLNERQKEALRSWKDEPFITTGRYQRKFGITDRTARRDLVELAAIGLLEKTGDKKTSKYIFRK
ncbi:MAG: DeoR family transcriptional regulator, partial [Chitinophagaceae bacterium]